MGTITDTLETLDVSRVNAGEIGVYLTLTREGHKALGDVLSAVGEVSVMAYGAIVKVFANDDDSMKTSIKVVRNVVQDFLLTLSKHQTETYLTST